MKYVVEEEKLSLRCYLCNEDLDIAIADSVPSHIHGDAHSRKLGFLNGFPEMYSQFKVSNDEQWRSALVADKHRGHLSVRDSPSRVDGALPHQGQPPPDQVAPIQMPQAAAYPATQNETPPGVITAGSL